MFTTRSSKVILSKGRGSRRLYNAAFPGTHADTIFFMVYLPTPPTRPLDGREEFLHFVALTEDELDEVCETLRRKYGAGLFSSAGASRKEQVGI